MHVAERTSVAKQRQSEPVRLVGLLRRDLDWIVMKTLEKDRTRRYETANGLVQDIERYLKSEPVIARPPTMLYTFGKLVRKHRTVVVVTAGFLLLLGVATVVSSNLALWAYRERDYARKNAEAEVQERLSAQKAVTRLEIERAEHLFTAEDAGFALAHLARLFRKEPTNRVVAERIMGALGQRSFSLPTAPLLQTSLPPNSQTRNAIALPFQMRNRCDVMAAQFSLNARRVVTATRHGLAIIWDADTGQPVGDPLQHAGAVLWAEFNPESTKVVTASQDGTAQIWDATTSLPAGPPLKHNKPVLFAKFHPDGTKVVTASQDNTIKIWSADTGQLLFSSEKYSGESYYAAFSPDGKFVLGAFLDGYTRVWRVGEPSPIKTVEQIIHFNSAVPFPVFHPSSDRIAVINVNASEVRNLSESETQWVSVRHPARITSAAFSPDGQNFATSSWDLSARVWDVQTGEPVTPPLWHNHGVYTVAFSHCGQRLVSTSTGGGVQVWDPHTGQNLIQPLRVEAGNWMAELSSDGQRLLTAGNEAWLWDARVGTLPTLRFPCRDRVEYAEFSADGDHIVTASWDASATIWEATTGHLVHELHSGGLHCLAAKFSPDGHRVVTTTAESVVRLWDADTGRLVREVLANANRFIEPGPSTSQAVQFSLEGSEFVVINGVSTATVFDSINGQSVAELHHDRKVTAAAFLGKEDTLVTGSSDGKLRLWNWRSGKQLSHMEQGAEITAVRLDPSGTVAAVACKDRIVKLWEVAAARRIAEIAHSDEVASLCFSPDGAFLAMAAGNVARVWDVRRLAPQTPPFRTRSSIRSVEFSADGRRIVTASSDGTARVWDAATGHALSEPIRHGGPVNHASFSPNGNFVLSAASDNLASLVEVAGGPIPFPDWLPNLAEALVGQRFNDQEMIEAVPIAELYKLRLKLEKSQANGYYDRWAKWFFADSSTRSISVSSAVTVPEFVGRLIHSDTLASLQEAVDLSPTNGLALAKLASKLLLSGTAASRDVTAAEWFSQRAVGLRPDIPEAWSARAEVLMRTQKIGDALQAIDRAIALRPQSGDSWALKTEILRKNGQQSQSIIARSNMLNLIRLNLTGQWDFDRGNLAATVGADLQWRDGEQGNTKRETKFGTTTELGIPGIDGKEARVMKFPAAKPSMGYILPHGAAPNDRGSRVNQYTLVMDVLFYDQSETRGSYSSLFQTDENNRDDGDLYARWRNGRAGIGIYQKYDGKISLHSGRWHRIAIAVDRVALKPVISKFIDGVKHSDQYEADSSSPGNYDRFSLGPTMLLFMDQDNETFEGYVNNIQFYDVKLSDQVIEVLGPATEQGVRYNSQHNAP